MAKGTVLYDACVLYPAPLRDLLMHLALVELFQAKWSDTIHDEWTRNLLKNRPELKPEPLQRTRELMNRHVKGSLVTDYEALIPTLTLPDPDDRHVLAAAIRGEASVIVTFNLRDFPAEALEPYAIRAEHPDRFISGLLDTDAQAVCLAVQRQRLNLKQPPYSPQDLLEAFRRTGLLTTALRLELVHRTNLRIPRPVVTSSRASPAAFYCS